MAHTSLNNVNSVKYKNIATFKKNTDELFNLLDRQIVQLVLHFRIPGQKEANVAQCSGCRVVASDQEHARLN
jgi:hypothetical protein